MEEHRIQVLNDNDFAAGKYVIYWMQQSQRAHHNQALGQAMSLANGYDLEVVVCFDLMEDYPEANERHCGFMLTGLPSLPRTKKYPEANFFLTFQRHKSYPSLSVFP